MIQIFHKKYINLISLSSNQTQFTNLLLFNIIFVFILFSSYVNANNLNAKEVIDPALNSLISLENKQEKPTNSSQHFKQLLNQANNLYKQKKYTGAIEKYSNSITYLQKNDPTTIKHKGSIYTKIAESYKRLKNREKTAYFYKKSLDIFIKLDNKKYIARTLNTLAESERYLGNLVIALEYSTESLKIHNTINDPTGYAKALMGAGIIYRHIERYEKSLKHIYKAYLYYKETNNYDGIAKTSNEMGNIYIKLEQFEEAKYFLKETINIPKEKISLTTLSSALRETAVIDFNDKNYDSALFFAKKAYNIYKDENEKLKESLTARIIANIFREQRNITKAISYYQKSLAIATQHNNELYQIKAQTPLAGIMITINTDEAILLLKNSLEIALRLKNKEQILYTYRTLRQAEDYKGNFKKALSYAKKEIKLANIIRNEYDEKKISLTKVALHSQKIEIELASLRERTKLDQLELIKKNNEIEIVRKTKMINELELKKNQYASIALTSLTTICLILVLFIYRSFIISKKRNKKLYHLASRDHLTNCYNRRALFKLMDKHILSKELDDQYCVIMADIDNFKQVNDTYGHNKGDSVIKSFSEVLQKSIRHDDVVARYGGEEFCIILKDISQEKALKIAEYIRKKIEKSTFSNISVTSSFGISSLEYGAKTASGLIEQADIALYKSKELGRNKVTFWDPAFAKE